MFSVRFQFNILTRNSGLENLSLLQNSGIIEQNSSSCISSELMQKSDCSQITLGLILKEKGKNTFLGTRLPLIFRQMNFKKCDRISFILSFIALQRAFILWYCFGWLVVWIWLQTRTTQFTEVLSNPLRGYIYVFNRLAFACVK